MMRTLRLVGVPLALYAVALGGLLIQLGDHPRIPYNWESYTAWNYWSYWAGSDRSVAERFALTDGLMTDSGRGPLLGLPVALGFTVDGIGLAAMRWPVAMVAALAVPLTWAVGRRLVSGSAATLAALLLAVSAVFVLYGRTATLVGISLTPALLTMLALVNLFAAPAGRWRWVWLLALQAMLALDAYGYAPIRLLWPLAIVALVAGAAGWRERQRFFAVAALVTLVTLPVILLLIKWWTTGTWAAAGTIIGYFQARGEHVFEMGDDPSRYLPYVRDLPPVAADPLRLAWSLISQNATDLLRLVVDWRTAPVVTEYWNPSGQLWPWFLAPFFWLGLGGLVVRSVRDRSWRAPLLLLLLLGLTLPLLLTTRVHVGRLVPALPLLLLTVACGWSVAWDVVARVAGRMLPVVRARTVGSVAMLGSGLVLVAATAVLTIGGYRNMPTETQDSRVLTAVSDLAAAAAEHGGAALVAPSTYGLEIEGVRAASLWLMLNRQYRLVDLTRPASDEAAGDRPPLYAVGALARLAAGDLPNACDNLYLVLPDAAAEFHKVARSADVRARCPAGLQFELLPE